MCFVAHGIQILKIRGGKGIKGRKVAGGTGHQFADGGKESRRSKMHEVEGMVLNHRPKKLMTSSQPQPHCPTRAVVFSAHNITLKCSSPLLLRMAILLEPGQRTGRNDSDGRQTLRGQMWQMCKVVLCHFLFSGPIVCLRLCSILWIRMFLQ